MSKKKDEMTQMRESMQAEIDKDAAELAPKLFPKDSPDRQKLSKAAAVEFYRRHWADVQFRLDTLDRMAPKKPDGTRPINGVRAFKTLAQDVLAGGLPDGMQPVLQGGPTIQADIATGEPLPQAAPGVVPESPVGNAGL